MKTLTFILLLFQILIKIAGQEINPDYDSLLAKNLGADDYGMKMYVFVILKTGDNIIDDKMKVDSLFNGHLKNISHLAEQGLLVVAGPFSKNDNKYRGMFILNVSTFDEATGLLQSDPAIKENLLTVDLYGWYGSAALYEYLNIHKKIEKYKTYK
jgi:uncharacterized protein YciI